LAADPATLPVLARALLYPFLSDPRVLIYSTRSANMLGDARQDAVLESEFADEYQDWLQGRPSISRAEWFDFPVRKLSRAKPLTVERGMSVRAVAERMHDLHCGSALVVERERLVGIFTERDLLVRVVTEGRDPGQTKVSDVMTDAPEALPEDASMAQALRFLSQTHYRHAPLVDARGTPTSMLSTSALIGFISETFPKEILNAPPESAEPIQEEEGA
jgi:CBS domain-containing protein